MLVFFSTMSFPILLFALSLAFLENYQRQKAIQGMEKRCITVFMPRHSITKEHRTFTVKQELAKYTWHNVQQRCRFDLLVHFC